MAKRPYTPLGIDHVVLYVRDQEISRKFYCEMLGCTVDAINEKAKASRSTIS
jgi:catechol 2,3-dioxygenase-like lactoylglutathione lyase family enzyme